MSRSFVVCVLFLSFFGINSFATQTCDPNGDIQFVCGLINPEDLYQVPGTPWVIASGRVSDVDGPIFAVDVRNHRSRVIFPENAVMPEHDTTNFQACPGPNASSFQPHGLTLREGTGGIHTLYVVGHGAREAIEVFNLDIRGSFPSLQWVGCIVAPEGTRRINSITALPNGSIAATNFDTTGGELWEWHSTSGWTEVLGSQMLGPNGLVSSADGQWFYVGGWSDQALVRLSRGRTPVQIDSAPVGFNVDNVRWGSDGDIVVAGHVTQCDGSSPCDLSVARVAKVNPNTLSVKQLVDYKGNEFFRLGTVAIEVGDEVWVGGIRGSLGIARFPQ